MQVAIFEKKVLTVKRTKRRSLLRAKRKALRPWRAAPPSRLAFQVAPDPGRGTEKNLKKLVDRERAKEYKLPSSPERSPALRQRFLKNLQKAVDTPETKRHSAFCAVSAARLVH